MKPLDAMHMVQCWRRHAAHTLGHTAQTLLSNRQYYLFSRMEMANLKPRNTYWKHSRPSLLKVLVERPAALALAAAWDSGMSSVNFPPSRAALVRECSDWGYEGTSDLYASALVVCRCVCELQPHYYRGLPGLVPSDAKSVRNR